jgi:hypothetical protein
MRLVVRGSWFVVDGSRLVVGGLIALLTVSCSTAPLPNAQDSPEALSRAVLAAIEKRDTGALLALAIDKEEFTEQVWQELPAARPERNLSPAFVWGDLNQKSNITLRGTLTAHGGRKYQFISIRFLGETTQYDSYRVHRESELTVKDADGVERQIRVFGSVLEKGGRYKAFSYVIDD